MKKRYATLAAAMMAVCGITAAESVNLPKVVILGKEYYYYEIKKGDSVYGIAKQFDWDPAQLMHLNPNTIATMEKGAKLYYPTTTNQNELTHAESRELDKMVYEPISHLVKKGETVYSIAHMYNIPLEAIYASHPSARYGVKIGEIIEIKQSAENIGGEGRYLYYNVRQGDTLYSISKEFGTSVESLLELNPGLSEKSMKIGSTVRINVNNNEEKVHTETVSEQRLAAVDNYKVQKNDTWTSISRKTGVDIDELKEANSTSGKLEKDAVIAVPVVENVDVELTVKDEDPRELTSKGIQEMYDSIHKVDAHVFDGSVNVAVLLDDPTSKRDIEFSRGFLLAVDELKDSSYGIKLKVIDGRSDSRQIEHELDKFSPHLVFSTADKNFPEYLADYGNTRKIEIVNVFNVKNDLYLDNPSMVQLLPPSNYFNDDVISYVGENYGDCQLVIVGERDSQDAIGEGIEQIFSSSHPVEASVSDIHNYEFANSEKYLIYCYNTRKEDVAKVVDEIEKATRNTPGAEITLVGRPSWVTLIDGLRDKITLSDVRIPSRFYYDELSDEAKSFAMDFHDLYGENPAKSFPMYSVTGYDVAHAFIPGVVYNGGDLNRGLPVTATLQSDIEPERVSNWGGFVNAVTYMLRFTPYGTIVKDRLH